MHKLSELLTQKISSLGLNIKTSRLYPRVERLYRELDRRKILFKPICYFADEWFVPEGDPVIGIPFYLANRDLVQLERKLMGDVEGDKPGYFMKLIRHETGHAISYAFNLHRKKKYRRIFGASHRLFSDFYKYDPKSKRFVTNLDEYYAQSHPDEDFAETFAVWLRHSPLKWKKIYNNRPALKKLLFVDELMTSVAGIKPRLKNGEKMCHVSTLKYTLWTYYMRRRSLAELGRRVKRG